MHPTQTSREVRTGNPERVGPRTTVTERTRRVYVARPLLTRGRLESDLRVLHDPPTEYRKTFGVRNSEKYKDRLKREGQVLIS